MTAFGNQFPFKFCQRRKNSKAQLSIRNGSVELPAFDREACAERIATNQALQTHIQDALGVVARTKGMAQIAGQTGLSDEQLYRSFSENGNPTLKSTFEVMKALGLDLIGKAHA